VPTTWRFYNKGDNAKRIAFTGELYEKRITLTMLNLSMKQAFSIFAFFNE